MMAGLWGSRIGRATGMDTSFSLKSVSYVCKEVRCVVDSTGC